MGVLDARAHRCVEHVADEAGELSADGHTPRDGGLDLGQLITIGTQEQCGIDVAAQAHGIGAVQQPQGRVHVHLVG